VFPLNALTKSWKGQPHIADAVINGQIDLIINTTKGAQTVSDAFSIRRLALMHKIPYYTLMTSAKAGVQAIRSLKSHDLTVEPLQSYF
jgi:carbamoyl-phosphate synthase large subunit